MQSTYTITGPSEVTRIFNDAKEKMIDQGKPAPDAERYAMRQVHNAGWYKASKGWKQLHPDVRDKVQVREAVRQPDGRYLIEGVQVFYPNAVKSRGGKSIPFGRDAIVRNIKNTNRAIGSGARLALTEGHPDPTINKALGQQTPSFGAPLNFREYPAGSGKVLCDLTDVEPGLVQKMKDRKLPGLSAGFAEDAGGLGERFGHVALLGAESQALAHLPTIDVYSTSNQLCFSADNHTFSFPKGKIMIDKTRAKEMADCYASYGAALASYAAGEEGAEHKLEEARGIHGANLIPYAAELNPVEDKLPGGAYEAGPEGGSNATELAEARLPDTTTATPNKAEFSAEDGRRLQEENRSIMKRLLMLSGRMVRSEYEKKRDELRAAGHQFDAESHDKMFEACTDSKNPAEALKRLYNLMEKSPKKESLAAIGTVFGAEASQRQKAAEDAPLSEKELADTLEQMYQATGKTYSANDLQLGNAFASIGRQS